MANDAEICCAALMCKSVTGFFITTEFLSKAWLPLANQTI